MGDEEEGGGREGGAITTSSRACGLRGVAFCPSSLLPCRSRKEKAHVGVRIFRIVARVCVFVRAHYSHTNSRKQLFDLRGENNPTTSSDSRMRADERCRGRRGSQGMLQYTRVGTSRSPRYATPPFGSLLLLRFNEMLRPLARDYFPIAPINSPFGLVSRGGTSFLPDNPWGYGFYRYFCTSLKGISISIGRA